MAASLQIKGPGMAALMKVAQELKIRPEVRVGIHSASAQRSGDAEGLTNVQLAFIHEFGSPKRGIPARSFLRSTADAKRDEWLRLMARTLGQVVKGKLSVEAALALVGMKAVTDIRATVLRGSGLSPPNAPRTVKAKGSSRPLVDTKQLINSLGYQVGTGTIVTPAKNDNGPSGKSKGGLKAFAHANRGKTRGGLKAFGASQKRRGK